MNERIKELAEQAKEYARNHVADCRTYGYYMEHNEYELQFEKKFAELIMKECIRVPYDMWDKSELNADIAVKIDHSIKYHFGVEE